MNKRLVYQAGFCRAKSDGSGEWLCVGRGATAEEARKDLEQKLSKRDDVEFVMDHRYEESSYVEREGA